MDMNLIFKKKSIIFFQDSYLLKSPDFAFQLFDKAKIKVESGADIKFYINKAFFETNSVLYERMSRYCDNNPRFIGSSIRGYNADDDTSQVLQKIKKILLKNPENNIVVICEKKLGNAIIEDNSLTKAIDRKIFLYFPKKDGTLVKFYSAQPKDVNNEAKEPKIEVPKDYLTVIPALSISIGDNVFDTSMNKYEIQEVVNSGGEGIIYSVKKNSKLVCKIYKPEKNTMDRAYKVKRLAEVENIDKNYVCLPYSPVFDRNKNFVGYIMPRMYKMDTLNVLFHGYRKLPDSYKKWDRVQLLTIIKRIYEQVYYLHQNNIILGDINEGNILINSAGIIKLIDTDSYQVDNYPCPVAVGEYVDPFYINEEFRTKESDTYSLAILAFRIMMLGDYPYCWDGDMSDLDCKKTGVFNYSLDQSITERKTPQGQNQIIWKYLPEKLKRMFIETFSNTGNRYEKGKRYQEKKWYYAIREYIDYLKNNPNFNVLVYKER